MYNSEERSGARTRSDTYTRLPLALKPRAAPRQCNSVIHDPLADSEIAIEPFLGLLIVGDGFSTETGPEVPNVGLIS